MAYLSRSSREASASTLAIGLVSEARVGDADGGSREVVVAVVVVVDESPAECVVSCARVVVGGRGGVLWRGGVRGFRAPIRPGAPE